MAKEKDRKQNLEINAQNLLDRKGTLILTSLLFENCLFRVSLVLGCGLGLGLLSGLFHLKCDYQFQSCERMLLNLIIAVLVPKYKVAVVFPVY